MSPLVLGLAGPALTAQERALFRDADPAGYILFRRNVESREQVRALTDGLRDLAGRDDLAILVDQEGGRVARLRPPEWPEFPPAAVFDRLWEVAPASAMEAARANAQAIALVLAEVGITVDCLPLLDVRRPGAHDIIGDRALGAEPLRVAALGRAVLEGLRAGGVTGVVKHVPGHGRAPADSHRELPVVDAAEAALADDLEPFTTLNRAPIAMTAHVLYPAWDAERCASLSPTIVADVIRGRIGFDGLLLSDDLGMAALGGSYAERTAGVLAAGCDLALHCSGDFAEVAECVAAAGAITARAAERLAAALAFRHAALDDQSFAELVAHRDALLALG